MELQKFNPTDIMNIGKAFAESGMFPDTKTAAQAVVKIQAGQEIGIPPFAAMTGIHIISGKPTIGAGLIASTVKGSGKYDYRVTAATDKICSIDFYQGKEKIGTSTFTIEDAKKAGTKNIEKFPKNMLFARAISNGVKWYCPDVFSGPVYVPEEMGTEIQTTQDIDVEVVEDDTELMTAIASIYEATTVEQLTEIKKASPAYIVSDASFIAAGKQRYQVLIAQSQNN